MTERTGTFVLLHVAVFLAGGTGLFGRIISLGGLPLVCFRIAVSLITLVSVLLVSGRLRRVPAAHVARIAACGVLLALHWVAFYSSIKASNVSVGVVCIATSCFFTTLIEPLFNGGRPRLGNLAVSIISILGILLIFSLDMRYRTGIALGLCSAALYSVFALCNIRVASRTGCDSATMLLWELAGGVVFLTACLPLCSVLSPAEAIVPTESDWGALLLLGSVFTVIPFLIQISALRRLSAFTVNVTYNLEPVYSILLAALLFGEAAEVGTSFWIGVLLVSVSVIIQMMPSLSRRKTDTDI